METKKNLNNTQRKMLDTLYSDQFRIKRAEIMAARDKKLADIRAKETKAFTARKEVKELLATCEKAEKLYRETSDTLAKAGFSLDGISFSSYSHVKLSVTDYRRENSPEVEAHNAETRAINERLNQAENEMRIKIYGSDVSYEDIEKDINDLLKGIA